MDDRRYGFFRWALVVIAGVVVFAVALSALLWIIGAVFGLVPVVLRLLVLFGVVGAAWWLLTGRRRTSRLR